MEPDRFQRTVYQPAGSLRTYQITSWCIGNRWYAELLDETARGWVSLARYGPAPDRGTVEERARLSAADHTWHYDR